MINLKVNEADSVKNNKDIAFSVINILVPLIIGAIIYYFISPNVIFVKIIDDFIGIRNQLTDIDLYSVLFRFIRNYFLDMLWAYALVFMLFLILGNNTSKIMRIFVIAVAFSTIMEILQFTSIAEGTFDVLDIVVEFIAELVAVFIIKIKYFFGGTKQYEKNN